MTLSNQTVALQRSLDKATRIGTATPANKTDAASWYKLTTKETAAGTCYYRQLCRDVTYAPSISRGVRVTVT